MRGETLELATAFALANAADLAAGEPRVNARKEETRPSAVQSREPRAGGSPVVKSHGVSVREIGFKNSVGGLGEEGIAQVDGEFVIDGERTRVEVRRADKNGVVDDGEFGVEHLRLVFPDADAGFE